MILKVVHLNWGCTQYALWLSQLWYVVDSQCLKKRRKNRKPAYQQTRVGWGLSFWLSRKHIHVILETPPAPKFILHSVKLTQRWKKGPGLKIYFLLFYWRCSCSSYVSFQESDVIFCFSNLANIWGFHMDFHILTALRIIGPSKLAILMTKHDTGSFKPFHWEGPMILRVVSFTGISEASNSVTPRKVHWCWP